jgi:hypothetical protein
MRFPAARSMIAVNNIVTSNALRPEYTAAAYSLERS